MNQKRIYMDIHAIQTLPPSCVNRDDTGSPKTAVYGGVRRARVSSQSWKRAMRQYFLEESGAELGVRSLNVISYVAEMIVKKNTDILFEKAMEMSEKIFKAAKIGIKDQKTKALFFLGKKQAEAIADAAIRGETDQKVLKQYFCENPAMDIALFGRMVADDPSLNEDASAQVAHAISTHEVRTEFDYYTAVDDLAPEDNAGASMLGTIEYNSSRLYRYANVALHELYQQIGDKERTIETAKLFIQAFSNSMPTGKIRTFANQTLPQFLMINIRKDRPVNLVTAFEEPVKPKRGIVEISINRLFDELTRTEKFVETPVKTFYVAGADCEKLESATEEDGLPVLLRDFGGLMENLL